MPEWCIDEGKDIHVNRLIEEMLPQAMTKDMVATATAADKSLQNLTKCLQSHSKEMCKKKAPEYAGVFEELSHFDGIIVRGSHGYSRLSQGRHNRFGTRRTSMRR